MRRIRRQCREQHADEQNTADALAFAAGRDDPRDLRGAVLVEPERAADVLDDLDLGPRVSAKQMASTPRSPVMSTPSPRMRTEVRNARCTRRLLVSMPRANCRSASSRSETRWSSHSQADQTRSGGTWRLASSSYSSVSIDDFGRLFAFATASSDASVTYSSAAVLGSFAATASA
ncbi:hypothetical protein ADK54_34520 [Streptomyces sp. WM6378]|nr:hypothetical protein ADK54_34520 [Streptomyces sp. WM6378]